MNSLMGVSHTICGYNKGEDNVMKVLGINVFRTRDMENRLSRRRISSLPAGGVQENWRSRTCVKFLTNVLGHIKGLNLPDDRERVCSLHWRYGESKMEVIRNDEGFGEKILPDWYPDSTPQ